MDQVDGEELLTRWWEAIQGPDQAAAREAAARLGAAAASGSPRGQFLLGLLHARGGAGVGLDEAAAARWCAAAAAQGLGAAQFNLALLHAAGRGVAADPAAAERWLRLAAANGIPEAEGCLGLIHAEEDQRPTSWQEAETRASVALARTDPQAPKSLRFAEYYVDPCIDHLSRQFQLSRDEIEDIVQQFMLELEEPLEKGAHRGRTWKDSLRERYRGHGPRGASRFRTYLGRVVENFARDWLRRRARRAAPAARPSAGPDPQQLAVLHEQDWRALLARFSAAMDRRPEAVRPARVLLLLLVDGREQRAVGELLGISERTVRSDLRLATSLLLAWLDALLPPPPHPPAIAEGLRLLPDWLHRPGGRKRARALLFLAVLERRLR